MTTKFMLIVALVAAIAAPVFVATDSYAKSKRAKTLRAQAPAYAAPRGPVYEGPIYGSAAGSPVQQWLDRAASPLNQQ